MAGALGRGAGDPGDRESGGTEPAVRMADCRPMGTPRPLLDGIRPPGNSFVLPDHKMVYISVTKSACTSIRWMVADLNGEDREDFHSIIGPQQSRLMTVHGVRPRWKKTPQLSKLPEAELAEISPDAGWLVFAVVRDPWSRLWSAWQSKFLVRHGYYDRRFSQEDWFPRIPQQSSDVVEDFRRFVEVHPWTWHEDLVKDRHFQPQVVSVQPQGINYSKIYDLARFSELTDDISAHLEAIGRPSELYLPRANETPLALTREVLGGGVADQVRELYRDDFAEWGDRWDLEALRYAPDGWTPDALASVGAQAAANERIRDLAEVARHYKTQAAKAEKKLARTRERLRAAKKRESGGAARPPRTLAGRARRALRRGPASG